MHLSSSGTRGWLGHVPLTAATGVRGKQKHMNPPKEPVHFHFCPRPLARASHMALPREKRPRNTLHREEAWPGMAAKTGDESGPIIHSTKQERASLF